MQYGRNTFNAFFVEAKRNAIQIRTSTAVLLGFSIVRFFRFLEICIAHCRGGWQVGHVESEKHMSTQINYGTNGLNTLKHWAGVHAVVLQQSTQTVHHGDLMNLLDNRQTIEVPALVMTSEEFHFTYTALEVAAELQRLAEVCSLHPGCVVKWTRQATQEQVDAAWKA